MPKFRRKELGVLQTAVLAFHVSLVALSLRHDVELTQVVLRHLAKGLSLLISPARSFPASCSTNLGDLLGFGEALLFRARATILPAK